MLYYSCSSDYPSYFVFQPCPGPIRVRYEGIYCTFCLLLQVLWLTLCTAVVGYVPEGRFKRWLNYHVSILCFEVLSSAISSVIRYHNTENRPKRGICVANHTSPIDVLVLMCDNCYSLVRYYFLSLCSEVSIKE